MFNCFLIFFPFHFFSVHSIRDKRSYNFAFYTFSWRHSMEWWLNNSIWSECQSVSLQSVFFHSLLSSFFSWATKLNFTFFEHSSDEWHEQWTVSMELGGGGGINKLPKAIRNTLCSRFFHPKLCLNIIFCEYSFHKVIHWHSASSAWMGATL